MEEKKKSGYATTGLVLGIIGVCISFIPIINNVAFILGILAIIFTIICIVKKASKGKAIAGLVLGIIAVAITLYSQYQLGNALNEVSSGLAGLANELENSLNVDQESQDKITLDKFNKIETGMTYEQVVEIVGSEGTLSAESSIGNSSMKMYIWEASNGIANATVTFTNGKVSAKGQIGL